jgi:hypothetical protein
VPALAIPIAIPVFEEGTGPLEWAGLARVILSRMLAVSRQRDTIFIAANE